MLILNLMLVTHFRPEGMGAINDWQSVGMLGENIPQFSRFTGYKRLRWALVVRLETVVNLLEV